MRGQEKDDIPRKEMNEAKEGNEKKERNASRNTKRKYNGGKKKSYRMGRQSIFLRVGDEDHNDE
jgi:hypothetical protein